MNSEGKRRQTVVITNSVVVLSLPAGFLEDLKLCYQQVKECRLKATRKESSEIYVFAKGYKQNAY